MNFLVFLVLLWVTSRTPFSSSNPEELYEICSNQFNCGKISAGFPFWNWEQRPGECGHPGLELQCENDDTTIIIFDDVRYKVLNISMEAKIMKIAREDYEGGICSREIRNTTLDAALFEIMPGYMDLTLFYDCPYYVTSNFSCNSGKGLIRPGVAAGFTGCSKTATVLVQIPVPLTTAEVTESLQNGFEVRWKVDQEACQKCLNSAGTCGIGYSNETVCYCELNNPSPVCRPPPAISPSPPAPKYTGSKTKKITVGAGLGIAGAAIAGILLGGWGLFAIQRRRRRNEVQSKSKDMPLPPSSIGLTSTTISTDRSRSIASYSSSDIERGSTYFGVQVFTYTELQAATDNFNPDKELGDGGFGTVYYGVLNDGRIVAVKRLYENNLKRVAQFKNEIKILADIRHPNLVTLYGCTSRHSRELLLVYEYIPNGTVAEHLHGRRAQSSPLTWPTRLNIAIETANALAYLHSRDIIHRDVKTNNILLDNNFRVKVADFGLSRLFPNDVTHVSTAPQGTPGYVDPEYYQCYHLTEKSDVYSLGVVLAELISAKEAVDVTRHRYDINLASMVVSRVQNRALRELVDPSLDVDNDCDVRRMVTSMAELAFRCLQQERDLRPSMEEVVEALREMKDGGLGGDGPEVVDIGGDDVGLLRHVPPPLSPDSGASDKWVQIRTM